jgi:hypothetical protein
MTFSFLKLKYEPHYYGLNSFVKKKEKQSNGMGEVKCEFFQFTKKFTQHIREKMHMTNI